MNEIPIWKRLLYITMTVSVMFFVGYLIFVGVNFG